MKTQWVGFVTAILVITSYKEKPYLYKIKIQVMHNIYNSISQIYNLWEIIIFYLVAWAWCLSTDQRSANVFHEAWWLSVVEAKENYPPRCLRTDQRSANVVHEARCLSGVEGKPKKIISTSEPKPVAWVESKDSISDLQSFRDNNLITRFYNSLANSNFAPLKTQEK